ncbi:DUF7149 domain-containing protein [Flavobacterium nackdongense]|uniref:site-specific DNA-methyltransferase (adenine-specific) n=1 Tax=Flavobacterium nackdongense TaxID=2547394 RepID=A0A4P6Y9P5_9FLAO|nr:TaqI-like C-terminal specificity domain-containing protein [Flavobacterium nackdongense]QBN19726.1 class I SAM-dependent DNA methyltransferase [Flavobacterium nackdongense]
MITILLEPRKALNKAFLKIKPSRSQIETFKTHLIGVLDAINEKETEEFHKNLVIDFLKKTYYDPNYSLNTKGRNDLVIHNGKDAKSNVGVIIEAKSPSNKTEMITGDNLNGKALQELVLYYLRERITHKNTELKHLVVTNIYEWFVFDAQLFNKLFAEKKSFVKQFTDFEEGRLSGKTTDFFYKEIAKPFIENLQNEIVFAYFDIRKYEKPLRNINKEDDKPLIALYKLISPEHLLKLSFANDSNSLDKNFYNELLHIIGLTEVKENGKKLIERHKKDNRHSGSLLENTIEQLDSLDKISRLQSAKQYGETYEERLFTVALELTITWVNRILFLKLLEAQLIAYHKGDKSYSFLNSDLIKDYDNLNSLFFQVLARKPQDRTDRVQTDFAKVPYLNSSLFEPTDLEHETLFVSGLEDNAHLPLLSSTVIKDNQGKKITGSKKALAYFFSFLDAYDFASEGSEDIQEDNKTLINASVLGLIFEKINGYKDGSIFTPGFITMYMSRNTIRRAVVQKFNIIKGWNCQSFEELKEDIQQELKAGDRKEVRKKANEIINSLKICDPAVGSGHFLVSVLNELIAIKSELNILVDNNWEPLNKYTIEVINDELIVTDEDDIAFSYKPKNKESQRVQESLFHEKQTLIENCLFGVDINPNSVKICRLRLWIELLKNAFYKPNTNELETLPNIDINIKCGNSLISRFGLDADLKKALKQSKLSIDVYKNAVKTYQNAESKEQKKEMEGLILSIKQSFSTEIRLNDPVKTRLEKLSSELYHRFTGTFLFESETPYGKSEKELEKKRKLEKEKLEKEIKKLEAHIEEIKNNKIYENAFEWRFEFPEVLNEDGDFVGFDVVIGNPPYIDAKKLADISILLKEKFKVYYSSSDLSSYFFELGINVLKDNGFVSFINTNKFFRTEYGKPLRKFISDNKIHSIVNFEQVPIFDEALVSSLIIIFEKNKMKSEFSFCEFSKEPSPLLDFSNQISIRNSIILPDSVSESSWAFNANVTSSLIEKLYLNSNKLKNINTIDIKRGVTTGFDPAFIISNEVANQISNNTVIKPLLKGAHIKKYKTVNSELSLIFTRRGYDIEEDMLIKEHLFAFYEDLRPRKKDEIRGRKSGEYKWYEIQDNIAYYKNFDKDKIIWPLTADKWGFALDTEKNYLSSGGFMLISETLDLKYLLSVLNSKLMNFLFTQIGVMTAGGAYTLKKATIEEFPIKEILKENQKPFIDKVNEILSLKSDNPQADTQTLEHEIDAMIYELYGLNEEDIAIVEGS